MYAYRDHLEFVPRYVTDAFPSVPTVGNYIGDEADLESDVEEEDEVGGQQDRAAHERDGMDGGEGMDLDDDRLPEPEELDDNGMVMQRPIGERIPFITNATFQSFFL